MTRFVSSLALGNSLAFSRGPFAILRLLLAFFLGAALLGSSATSEARSIYLNGVDISNARNQSLEGVDIRIDAEGNVFIIGNHYEIHQQEPVAPLVPKANLPKTPPSHRSGAKLPGAKIEGPAGHPPLPPSYRSGGTGGKVKAKAPVATQPPSSATTTTQ